MEIRLDRTEFRTAPPGAGRKQRTKKWNRLLNYKGPVRMRLSFLGSVAAGPNVMDHTGDSRHHFDPTTTSRSWTPKGTSES